MATKKKSTKKPHDNRDARTGKFVSDSYAAKNKSTTVRESRKKK